MRRALYSSVVGEIIAEGERLFQRETVRSEKPEFFMATLYVWFLQYWALCDDLKKKKKKTPAVKFLDLIFCNNFFIFNFSKMCSR